MKVITDFDLQNKTVVLRCDFNISVKNNEIVDDTRIVKSLKTINYLLDNNCKVIILSHFGRIKEEIDKEKYSLKIIGERLSDLLGRNVIYLNKCFGEDVKKYVDSISLGEVILLENTRYTDFPEKKESNNDLNLSLFWSSLGDIYINDAFGASHRKHSSVAGICLYMPHGIGFLIQEEISNLSYIIHSDEKPFTVFMGGAKVETKLPIIKSMLEKCDYLLLGGGILNSFLKVNGVDIKESLATNDDAIMEEINELLTKYSDKIILDVKYEFFDNKILDIDVSSYEKYIALSKLIFINGTPGLFEDEKHRAGTKNLFEYIKKSSAKKIAGGGDTITAINKFDATRDFDFISSGGGAALEYIAEGGLVALEWMEK